MVATGHAVQQCEEVVQRAGGVARGVHPRVRGQVQGRAGYEAEGPDHSHPHRQALGDHLVVRQEHRGRRGRRQAHSHGYTYTQSGMMHIRDRSFVYASKIA